MIQFSEPNEENVIKILWIYDGDFDIIGEIHPYNNRWASLPDYFVADGLEEVKEHIRREYSHL